MASYKKTRRNVRSKRQKSRSFKRRNVKSRKVMRGGGFDKADIGVLKNEKAKLYKIPVEVGPDGQIKLSTHDIQYKISGLLKSPDGKDVARIQVTKIDNDDIGNYSTHINYPTGSTETYQLNPNMPNSGGLKMTNGPNYGFVEILY